MRRVVLIVIDSLGVGALPDAERCGDAGAHTLDHVAAAAGPLEVPWLAALGLGCVPGVNGLPCPHRPRASYGRLAERSPGKDTPTGHWELMGCTLDAPFPTFPDGFAPELIEALVRANGLPGVLGNVPASGTEILELLGAESVESGRPIVYTSADSVLQVAAHAERFGLERMYGVCEVARELTRPLGLGRVIARPFVDAPSGAPTRFVRTYDRRDWALEPPRETALDRLQAAGVPTIGVGKIGDIFAGRGLSASLHSEGDRDAMRITCEQARTLEHGLVFTNLVDFDSLYGHRRDPQGYARNLEALDRDLAALEPLLRPDDLLILTADHGNDPTWPGTDHTRAYVPLLEWSPGRTWGEALGTRDTFAVVGQRVEAWLASE
ncbi:MAG TPA: phosphopentomutase, partial [Planctomycetota bacterium]|nr:phosphopentomutase [Planctomycetota bacterium]